MKRGTAALVAVTAIALIAPNSALAARSWGGTGSNDLGPAYGLFRVANGKVTVTNFQMVLSCQDTSDGEFSDRAFDVHGRGPTALRRNHYFARFSAESMGRQGEVRLEGDFRSNGSGAVRATISAVGRGSGGAIVERCGGSVRLTLRRGPGS